MKISLSNFNWNFKEEDKKERQEWTREENIKVQNPESGLALKNNLVVDTAYQGKVKVKSVQLVKLHTEMLKNSS